MSLTHESVPIDIYPWLHPTYTSVLTNFLSTNNLHHALLVYGIDGIGKQNLVKNISQYLLCTAIDKLLYCDNCANCRWFKNNNHPDILVIKENKFGNIPLDDVLRVQDFIYTTAHFEGGFKIVLFFNADKLNKNASNALLKVLEEPPLKKLFILVSDNLDNILLTIRSRCFIINCQAPSVTEAKTWLEEQTLKDKDDAKKYLALLPQQPLLAVDAYTEKYTSLLSIKDDLYKLLQNDLSIHELVTKWGNFDLKQCYNLLWKICYEILLLQNLHLTWEKTSYISINLQNKIAAINPRSLFGFIDKLHAHIAASVEGYNLNKNLVLTSLFISWQKICLND